MLVKTTIEFKIESITLNKLNTILFTGWLRDLLIAVINYTAAKTARPSELAVQQCASEKQKLN